MESSPPAVIYTDAEAVQLNQVKHGGNVQECGSYRFQHHAQKHNEQDVVIQFPLTAAALCRATDGPDLQLRVRHIETFLNKLVIHLD